MVLVLIYAAAACAARPPAPGGALRVVTTTTQLTDFARVVGGRFVHVYGVVKPNVDPHDVEPSPADLQQMADADVLVKNGLGLEKWLEAAIDSAQPKGRVVDTSNGLALRLPAGSGDPSDADPHIWQDPRNATLMVRDIEEAFASADSAHEKEYHRNARRYMAQLAALDREVSAELRALPNKKLVTNHDAFGYYVDQYGLDFVGSVLPSFDSQAELSSADVRRIVAEIRRTGVHAVFSEASLPAKAARTIGREAGVKVVDGPDALYGDSLGPPGSAGDTYLKMIRHNTKEIVDNLS